MKSWTILGAALLAMAAAGAHAATRTWVGGHNGNRWSDPANWQGGVRPVAGDRLVFGDTSTGPTVVNDIFNTRFEALEVRGATPYAFGGEPLNLTGSPGLQFESSAALIRFDTALRFESLAPKIVVRGSGGEVASVLFSPMVIRGTLTVDAPGANLTFDNITPFVQPAGLDLVAGDVRLQGVSPFAGDVFLTARSIVAGPDALGLKSSVTFVRPGSGLLQMTAPRTELQRYDLRGTGQHAGVQVHDGVVTELFVTGTQRIDSLGSFELRGPVIGTGRLVIDGRRDSTVLFKGTTENSFLGALEVRNGKLKFGSKDAMRVENDLVVNGPGAVLVAGDFDQTVRRFECHGGLVDWTPSDKAIEATHGVLLDGCRLRITFEPGTLPDPEVFTLLRNDTAVPPGRFAGLAPGARIFIDGQERVVSYESGGSRSDVALIRAYGLQSLRATPVENLSLPVGEVLASPLEVRSFDLNGKPRVGATLRETVSPAGCGTFPGGVEVVDLVTDGEGKASSLPFRAAGYNVVCTLTITTVPGGAAASVDIVVYDPASLRMWTDGEYALAEAGVEKTFTARLTAGGFEGVGVPGVPVTWQIRTMGNAGGDAGAASAVTGADGYATFKVLPNGSAGSYEVVARAGGAEKAVLVTQGNTIASRTKADPGFAGRSVVVMDGGGTCHLDSASFEAKVPAPAAGWAFPRGVMRLAASGCTAGATHFRVMDSQAPLRRNGVFMRYGATPGNAQPHWEILETHFDHDLDGHRFALLNGTQDDDLSANGAIGALVAFAVPAADYQDLWWGGVAEDGWGVSVVQHRDTLFSVIYAYDNAGKPVWYVMSGGTWNAAHTAYTGPVYLAHGSPFFAYNASALVLGNPVGTVTLRFASTAGATLEYTINGVTGTKSIGRFAFGDARSYAPVRGDMWWGGLAQNGWGIASLSQGDKLFSLWFTYDAAGNATWFVMPDGAYSRAQRTFDGRLYRTVGAPWLGVQYNPAPLQTIDVGAYRFDFSGDSARYGYSNEGHGGTMALERMGF